MKIITSLTATMLLAAATLHAQTAEPIRLDAGLTASSFQQQVKTEIGGERGERLVDEFQIGLAVSGTYRLIDNLSIGLFARADIGSRSAARFDGFDASGRTQVRGELGGDYTEFWLGPMARASWRFLSAELGYAALGIRSDDGRSDIASTTGDTTGTFATNPTIAWLLALGADVPLDENLALTVKLEYRIRYYSSRGGESLANNIEHGTQSIAPLIGIAWRL